MFKFHGFAPWLRFIEGAEGGEGGGNSPAADPPADPPAEGDDKTPKTLEDALKSIEKLTNSLKRERDEHKGTRSKVSRVTELERELEAERAKTQTAEEKALADARKEAAGEVTAKVTDRLISERVRSLATAAGAKNASTVAALLKSNGSLAEMKLGDDLEVDDAAITAVINDLKKSDDYLFGDSAPKVADRTRGGAGAVNSGGANKPASLAEAIAKKMANH